MSSATGVSSAVSTVCMSFVLVVHLLWLCACILMNMGCMCMCVWVSVCDWSDGDWIIYRIFAQ